MLLSTLSEGLFYKKNTFDVIFLFWVTIIKIMLIFGNDFKLTNNYERQ